MYVVNFIGEWLCKREVENLLKITNDSSFVKYVGIVSETAFLYDELLYKILIFFILKTHFSHMYIEVFSK